ncbi:MAG: lipopolysaccharide heptosyltransferase II [Planctomycetes bacterium]|nr:lipopolysaccharide heptosyltransferase II [Planctomycetota bacterium]
MNVGIFLPNWVGDVVMATPTLRALSRRFGDDRLIGVMRPHVADVLAGTRWLDSVIHYDPRSCDPHVKDFNVLVQLRQARLDAVVLMTNSWRTALLGWLSGAKQRVGYGREGRSWLLTHPLRPTMHGRKYVPGPVLDYYLELAYALGCERESPVMELATRGVDEFQVDALWRKHALVGQRVVTLNSSGAFGAAKLWPTEYFAELARRIVLQLDRSVLVLCGPSERAIAAQIVAGANHPRVVSLANEDIGLGLSKACVRRSELLVTTDSGPRHFAGAFGVPVVTLFGPTDQAWSDNHFPHATNLQLRLDCSPCQQRVCPLGHHRCMRDLTVEQVYRAVAAHLGGGEQVHAA